MRRSAILRSVALLEGLVARLLYGAGLRVDFSRNFSVTGDWTRYELDEVEVEMVSAGIQFRFR